MSVPASAFGQALTAAFGEDFVSTRLSDDVVLARLDPAMLEQHFSWSDLNEILTRGVVAPAELKLCTGGRSIPEHEYLTSRDGHRVLDLAEVFSLVRSGASLIIDSLDRIHPQIRAATDDVMRFVGETASCNLFVTFGESQAFTSHYDEVDTFVVQVLGTKQWQVHGASEDYPLPEYGDSDPARCPESVRFARTLVPGDAIHVPRGWWHTVRGGGQYSLHLTFAFTRRTGYDWLRWVVWRTLSNRDVRDSLARAGSPETQLAQAKRLIAAFDEEAARLSLADFFTDERRQAGGRDIASLPGEVVPSTISAECEVEVATVQPPLATVDGDQVVITAAGRSFTLPGTHRAVLELLLSERRIRLGELAARTGSSATAVSSLVAALLRVRLVTVTGPR